MSYFVTVSSLVGGGILGRQSVTLPISTSPVDIVVPAAGATVNVYEHGTTTPVDVYATSDGSGDPASQPITTDSNGDIVISEGVSAYLEQPAVVDIVVSGSTLAVARTFVVGLPEDGEGGGGSTGIGLAVEGSSGGKVLETDGSGNLQEGVGTTALASAIAAANGALPASVAGTVVTHAATDFEAAGTAASQISALHLGTASTHASTDFDAAGASASAITVHIAATDPHGDRSYAAGLVTTETASRIAADALKAPLLNPVFSGASGDTPAGSDSSSKFATTLFVQNLISAAASGLTVHQASQWATNGALASNTYNNGAGTLTANANGALSVDGGAPALNDRVIVKDEATQTHNGIYTVTTVGSGSVPWVLTRATDMSTGTEVEGAYSFVSGTGGTINSNSGWSVSGSGPWTLGTTAIVWNQFSAAGTVTASNGLVKTGQNIAPTYGTTANTVAQGNDARIVGAAQASTLGSASTHPATDFDAAGAASNVAAAIFQAASAGPRGAMSASGTLVANSVQPLTGAAGTATAVVNAALPTAGLAIGNWILTKRTDDGTAVGAFATNVTGLIRGVAASSVSLTLTNDSILWVYLGSSAGWYDFAGHKTLGSLLAYMDANVALAAGQVTVNGSGFGTLADTDADLQTTLNDIDANLTTALSTAAAAATPADVTAATDGLIMQVTENSDASWPSRNPNGPTQWVSLGTDKGAYAAGTFQQYDIVTSGGNSYSSKITQTLSGAFNASNWYEIPVALGDSLIEK